MFHQPSKTIYVVMKINDPRYVRLQTAGVPGQGGGGGEADHQVEDGPGHDDAVVHVQEAHLGPGVSVNTLLLCVPLTRTMVAGPVPPSSGHSRPTSVMPPSPRYWPTATSEHSKHQYSLGDIVAFIQILLEYRSWRRSSSHRGRRWVSRTEPWR